MEEALSKIAKLERELKEKNETLVLSATIGKDLLEQNGFLNVKLEEALNQNHAKQEKLQQENYALSMKCQRKEATLQTLTSEIEHVEASSKLKLDQCKTAHSEETNKLNDKISSQAKLVTLLEDEKNTDANIINDLQAELKFLREKCHESIVHEISVCTTDDSLQLQIVSLTNEKSVIEDELKAVRRCLKQHQNKMSFLEETVRQNSQELEVKECELTSLHNIIEKKGTEIQELQVEIENMNIAQIDPKKRGNSLFAELEDNRQMVERKYLQLKDNFVVVDKMYQYQHDQCNRLKMQVGSLLAQSANRGSLEYQEDLQTNIASLQAQLRDMISHCEKLEQKVDEGSKCPCLKKDTNPESMLDGYRHLFKQAHITLEMKEKEIKDLLLSKAYLTDQIFCLQRKINTANRAKDSYSGEIIRLRVKLEECGVDLDADKYNQVICQRAEKLPFFEEIQRKKAEKEEEQRLRKLEVEENAKRKAESPTDEVSVKQDGEVQSNEETKEECLTTSPTDEEGKPDEKENSSKCPTKLSKGVKFHESAVDNEKTENDRPPLTDKNNAAKPKKKLKKMVAPHIVVTDYKEPQCNQQ